MYVFSLGNVNHVEALKEAEKVVEYPVNVFN
jgi:hypothetical protein